jgi:homoserine kinase
MAPATSANLGPGFDCLGLALDLWNQLDVLPGGASAGSGRTTVEVIGEGAGELPTDGENLVYRSMAFLFHEAGQEIPPLRLRCHNQIPLKRGLGSSAAAIASGLVAANALCSNAFPSNELLEMAATIEGHPDNVAAAIMGGLQLVVAEEDQGRSQGVRLFAAPINVPLELHAVLFVPEVRIATADARAVLPEKVSRGDAVYNMSRTALLVAGMAVNRPEYFAVATQDRLHQPYRQSLFPAMKVIFAAARNAGALGVFLSGSGSTILALTRGREMTVAYEMAEAARQAGVPGQVKITQPTIRGAYVMEEMG